jgi:ribosomal protein S18 acetylase RimI-like enzyme
MSGTGFIRPAIAADEAAITGVVHDAYRHYIARIGREPGPMGDDYAARIAAGQSWVLDDAGAVAGIVVIEATPGHFLLDNIAVSPAFQGRGYGRILMEFVEGRAREAGYDHVRLYTHVMMTENIALYQKLGFVETGRVSEKGFDRVYMAKLLTPASASEAAAPR